MAEEKSQGNSDLDPGIEVSDILHNLDFIFVCHGVVLPIIVVVGVVLNSLCLAVLFRPCFRCCPPYCLLQALTLCDLAILLLSVYSDVHPAIVSHRAVQGMVRPEEQVLRNLKSTLTKRAASLNATDDELERFLKTLLGPDVGLTQQLIHVPFGSDNDSMENDLNHGFVVNTGSNLQITTKTTQENDTDTTSVENGSSDIQINTKPVVQAVERFVAYFLMTYNLLLITVLAVERCFVVVRPMKAKLVVTVYRTRFAIFVISCVCVVVHSPQLIKEVVFACSQSSKLKDDFQGTLLQSFRRHYETFVMCLTSFLLVVVIVLNVILTAFVMTQRKGLRKTLRSSAEFADRKHNLNIAYVLMFLTCCLLPPVIAGNVLSYLTMASFKRHINAFIKTLVIIRVLYVSNSGLGCLFYCLIGRRFRHVFLDTYLVCCRRSQRPRRTGFDVGSSAEVSSSKSRVTVQASGSPLSSVSERLHGSLTFRSIP